jgi:hypothetical protein
LPTQSRRNPSCYSIPTLAVPLLHHKYRQPLQVGRSRTLSHRFSTRLGMFQHQRTMSSMSALSSHPPSSYPTNDPFRDPFNAPGAPTKAVPPTHNRRSSMALPTFDTTSSGASRDSNYTFFGEPGPSRPGTNLFTPGLPTGRTVRQSDPFDLDRPEVLGFGDVIGRKEVGGSVTRQASRNRRVSSVGNWFSTAGQYTANSAKPGPLFGPNAKR